MISDWSKASLKSMQEAARQDDVLDKMVPSDLRVLLMRYETIWDEAIEAAAATAKNDAFPEWRESILRLKRQTGGRMDE